MAGLCQQETHALQQICRCEAVKWARGKLRLARARQDDLKFGEKSELRLDIDAAAVLFYDDVVAHRQAKPGTVARGLGREERVEYFVSDLFRDAGSIIPNTNFNLVSEVLRYEASVRRAVSD